MSRDELMQDKEKLEHERALALANLHRVDGALAFVHHKLAEWDKAQADARATAPVDAPAKTPD